MVTSRDNSVIDEGEQAFVGLEGQASGFRWDAQEALVRQGAEGPSGDGSGERHHTTQGKGDRAPVWLGKFRAVAVREAAIGAGQHEGSIFGQREGSQETGAARERKQASFVRSRYGREAEQTAAVSQQEDEAAFNPGEDGERVADARRQGKGQGSAELEALEGGFAGESPGVGAVGEQEQAAGGAQLRNGEEMTDLFGAEGITLETFEFLQAGAEVSQLLQQREGANEQAREIGEEQEALFRGQEAGRRERSTRAGG